MTREIKLEAWDPERMAHAIRTYHMQRDAELFDPRNRFVDRQVTTAVHPVHVFRLATQDIRVAFDPESHTLFIGETRERGYIEEQAQRALHEGHDNPFYREVREAAWHRDAADAARTKHASVVQDAIERLKSPKKGVRRRAKRLLERLGR